MLYVAIAWDSRWKGLPVEGQSWLERYLEVDFELERRRIFHLFSGKSVLRKILYLESRVLKSLGVSFQF